MDWMTDEEWENRRAEIPAAIREAHRHSIHNRSEIEASEKCGCFYCCAVFPADEVRDWGDTYESDTAACPRCGIDSVIGSASEVAITQEFLREMKYYLFTIRAN